LKANADETFGVLIGTFKAGVKNKIGVTGMHEKGVVYAKVIRERRRTFNV